MSWWSQSTFEEVEERFGPGLIEALRFYLSDAKRAEMIAAVTMLAARSEWDRTGGEQSGLNLLARMASRLSRPESGVAAEPEELLRIAELEAQLLRYLDMWRFERAIAEMDATIVEFRAAARAEGRDLTEEIAEMEARRDRQIAAFYGAIVRIDDDDELGGSAKLCPVGPPPPQRSPGERRPFADADAPPRNP